MTAIPGALLHPGAGADQGRAIGRIALPQMRVVFNRDERRSRSRALPPAITKFRDRRAVMPTDPDGGGTWLAANDAGLVFALLNVTRTARSGHTAPAPKPGHYTSRGQIIPCVADCATVDDARAGVQALTLDEFLPFQLMVLSAVETLDIVWDGNRWRMTRSPLRSPCLRTSSSLGDTRVRAPRRALFERMFRSRPMSASVQDAFHHHVWPARPEVSVLMSRPDAITVSITAVELYPDRVEMTYGALGDRKPPTRLALGRA